MYNFFFDKLSKNNLPGSQVYIFSIYDLPLYIAANFVSSCSSSQWSAVRVKVVGGSSTPGKLPASAFEAVTLIHRRADHTTDPDIPFSNLRLTAVYESQFSKKGQEYFLSYCLY